MTPTMINSDTICDLQGQSLHPDSVILLRALDKLLTVGAYYSTEHDQYLQAAMKARDAIVGVIGGPSQFVAIEITAQGLMVGRQNIDPNHRNVRLLHDLLVPLNIAKFEIDGTLTPEDLRQALKALQEHKTALGQSNSFQEIVIENLPTSVRAISRSVLQQGDGSGSGGGSLDELLGKWDETSATDEPAEAENESERLAREFMDMVTKILANLEQMDREAGVQPVDSESGSYVTQADLVALKQALQRLVEVNPDPADLTKLISHAQRAMDLSRDTQSVDLVFRILKKDMAEKRPDKPRRKTSAKSLPEFKLTVDELRAGIVKLEGDSRLVAEPVAGSRANKLAIGFHLLRSDPPRALRTSLVDIIESAVAEPDFAVLNMQLCARAIETVAREDGTENIDDLLPLVTSVLRQKRGDLIAPFWARLISEISAENLPEIWPHLVNDLLLGLEQAPPETVMKLALTAGQIPLKAATAQGRRLEKQPAMQNKSAAPDLFVAPLPSLQPVLAMLVSSPLKDWLGEELYQHLCTKPPSPLAGVVMAALGEHHAEHTGFYLELIRHSDDDILPSAVGLPAAAILTECLADLAPKRRQEPWIPQGLAELANLTPEQARPILERVLRERKFLFFKAWPVAARTVAQRSLLPVQSEVR